MKKWNMMLLALALMLLPAAGHAQNLPDFLSAVYTGVEEGLQQGAAVAMASMDQELTLEVEPSSARIEEGQTILLTIRAGNPRAQEAHVSLTLDVPKRLTAQEDAAWEAVLPPAQLDAQTGELVPSETVFTRELTLSAGGESAQAEITAEMSMGTRFYRTKTPLALCVPDISAQAEMTGAQEGRLQPGDAFAYRVEIVNAGDAAKTVAVELITPDGVTAGDAIPEGFEKNGKSIRGAVQVGAAGEEPAQIELTFPLAVDADALEGDADARRLLSGLLRVDTERVALPRAEVCGAKISAKLMSEKEELEAGETAALSVVVTNSGLAAADVRLSCLLPQGLTLQTEEKAKEKAEEKTEEKRAGDKKDGEDKDAPARGRDILPKTSGAPGAGEAVPVDGAEAAVMAQAARSQENRMLVFDLHMDAAKETQDGVSANTQVIRIPVTALAPQDKLSEALLSAALAWSVDDAPAQLGEAVALRVVRDTFLGVTKEEWNGVFWACVLLAAAVLCLYAAAHRDNKQEDFCCD